MKLLISAYACAPHHGSEHAGGWNWTTEAYRLGHEVWALVSPAHRNAIESAARCDVAASGIRWIFPELSFWPLKPGIEPKWERTYNLLWQRAALQHARELQKKVRFDVIHHLTWGGVRAPTFLGALGPPLIIGPMGGGETSPSSLRDGFRFRGKVLESLRDISNGTINLNPVLRVGLKRAAVVFTKTSDTRDLLSRAERDKSIVFMEVSVPKAQIGRPRAMRKGPPRVLYAGRLLYWKGVHIAIRAFAEMLPRFPSARFTIVGRGPEEVRLRADVLAQNIENSVDFIPWLSQSELSKLYDVHDLLLFPSLHDSSGWVVLEALCQGLPVVCLDLGGPKDIVTPESGVIIKTAGLTTSQVASNMAAHLRELFASPVTLSALSAGAISRANEFLLPNRVCEFYQKASKFIIESKMLLRPPNSRAEKPSTEETSVGSPS
jgi:glycosyltransferase involved in cell wall biosynthesis